ncbi:MAG: neutral zinc metallopeptidase [Gemmatimonadota bacterium]|nr:neutral zinc metallopeptidase [Gemmatimonadota bacterium]
MRWRQSRQSQNVDDRRGQRAASGGLRIGGGAGLLIVVAVILLGGDPRQVLQLLSGAGGGGVGPTSTESQPIPANDETGQFLGAVLGMTEDVWTEIFQASGVRYEPPTMVLFTDAVESACGYNTSATGPFYCPPDQNLYLDTGFFDQLADMGGAGDFAQGYVIGHEVGHHIQTLVGTSGWVRGLRAGAGEAESNQLQVLMELQADCYSGVWAHHANRRENVLEPGDVDEGLAAAAAIGDDRLQRRAGRAVSPESFTHGSSAQRRQWLETGLRTGDIDACDTFGQAGYVRTR